MRRKAAEVKELRRVNLPRLEYWNYGGCAVHPEPKVDCQYRACGGEFFDHQSVTITWLYLNGSGMVASVPGAGKAQPLDARVLTPSGWKEMGQLAVGDDVLTRHGRPTKVVGVFPQPVQQIYRVTLSDGSSTRVTGEHLWKVRARRGWVVRTTLELLSGQRSESWRTHEGQSRHGVRAGNRAGVMAPLIKDGRCSYSLPSVELKTEEREQPFDPYVMGALLGDGSFRSTSLIFSCADTELLEDVRLRLPEGFTVRGPRGSTSVDYQLYGPGPGTTGSNLIITALRDYGLWGLYSDDKFIPGDYMLGSYDQRMELLRGLMDTDGHAGDHSTEYTSTSRRLAEDVADLVRSLGGFASVREKSTTWTHRGVRKHGKAWRVQLNTPECPFRLRRKAERWRPGQKDRRIRSIEPDGVESAQCIAVEDAEHLYVTDHYIVTHNTNVALGLLALLKGRGELTGRAIIVCQTPAVMQWWREASRFTPALHVEAIYSGLDRKSRIERYCRNWDVLVIGYHLLMKDIDMLEELKPSVVITDDVDPLLDHANRTHRAIVRLAEYANRVVIMNASSIQTRLQQLHASMVPMGGRQILGSLASFERKHLRFENTTLYGRKGKKVTKRDFVGIKNMNDLRERIKPWVIRYTYDDLTDVKMPALMPPEDVWLDLHPLQRDRYEELRKGVLKVITEEGTQIKHAKALAMFTYGSMIASGLPALGEADGPQASVKLDWLMDKILGEWSDRKIVVFIKNKGLVEAFQQRLEAAGVGYGTVWGRERDPMIREAEKDRFWKDPNCRVFMGTSAIERSLNLHVANIVVNVDVVLNPERMKQILGRVRRAGSAHDHVFVFTLLCVDTQEEGYLDVLRRREAVNAAVWGEQQEMFAALSALELLTLIRA